MDTPWLLVLGCATLIAVVLDQLATILSAESGRGLLVPRLHERLWDVVVWRHRHRDPAWWLPLVGPVLLLLGPVLWFVGLWAGWSLVFLADKGAVLTSTTAEPASAVDRVYFAGFSVFTLGIGDVVPGAGPWALATIVAAAMGLAMVTLGITYLVPVIQAATTTRRTARTLSRANDLARGDEDSRSAALELVWNSIDNLDQVAEQHRTYHVLRFFRPRQSKLSLTTQVAAGLDWVGSTTPSDANTARAAAVHAALDELGRAITGIEGSAEKLRRALDEP